MSCQTKSDGIIEDCLSILHLPNMKEACNYLGINQIPHATSSVQPHSVEVKINATENHTKGNHDFLATNFQILTLFYRMDELLNLTQ